MPELPNRERENERGKGEYSDSASEEALPLRDSAGLPKNRSLGHQLPSLCAARPGDRRT